MLQTKVFKFCCALIALRFLSFFQLKAQFYTLNLIFFQFDRKNVVFALCYEILVAEVKLSLNNLVPKCHFVMGNKVAL